MFTQYLHNLFCILANIHIEIYYIYQQGQPRIYEKMCVELFLQTTETTNTKIKITKSIVLP